MKPWVWETPASILDPEEDPEGKATPPFARQHGLRYVLAMQDVPSIVENAGEQRPRLDDATLLKAFLYYFDHDAFITL